jgi:hypothetical protein
VQQIKHRQPGLFTGDRFAVDDAGPGRQCSDGIDYQREAIGEVIALRVISRTLSPSR